MLTVLTGSRCRFHVSRGILLLRLLLLASSDDAAPFAFVSLKLGPWKGPTKQLVRPHIFRKVALLRADARVLQITLARLVLNTRSQLSDFSVTTSRKPWKAAEAELKGTGRRSQWTTIGWSF